MKTKAAPPDEVNLLDLVPVQNLAWESDETGRVVLLKPKIKNAFLARHLLPRMRKPHYKIRLDEIGSAFWLRCDGQRSIQAIAELQKREFGDAVEPLYERISRFLRTLEKNRFITFEKK